MRSDKERIDWLESFLAGGPESAVVLLSAWYSAPGGPDGFSCAVGERIPDPEEFPSLRAAIDNAIEREEGV